MALADLQALAAPTSSTNNSSLQPSPNTPSTTVGDTSLQALTAAAHGQSSSQVPSGGQNTSPTNPSDVSTAPTQHSGGIFSFLGKLGKNAVSDVWNAGKGFISDVQKSSSEAGAQFGTDVKAGISTPGSETFGGTARTGIRTAGDVAKAGMGVVTSALDRSGITGAVSGEVKNMGDVLKMVTPNAVSAPLKEGLSHLVSGSTDAYNTWKEKNPETARDLESIGQIAQAATTLEGAGAIKEAAPGALSDFAEGTKPLVDKAGAAIKKDVQATVEDMSGTVKTVKDKVAKDAAQKELATLTEDARPALSKSEQIAARKAGRETSATAFKPSQIEANAKDLERGKLMQEIGVDPKADVNAKIETINAARAKEAQATIEGVKKNDGIFNESQLRSHLASIEKPPTLVGDLEKTYQKVQDKFMEFVNQQPKKLSGLLQARKSFDSWIGEQIPDLYTNEKNTALRQAVKNMRNAGNDYIESRLPEGSPFRDQLRRQHLMFEASENLAEKGQKMAGKNKIQAWVKANPNKANALRYGAEVTGLGAAGAITKKVLD